LAAKLVPITGPERTFAQKNGGAALAQRLMEGAQALGLFS
jgi:hypothetical protein